MMSSIFPEDFFQYSAGLFAVLDAEARLVQVAGAWQQQLQLSTPQLLQSRFTEWLETDDVVSITSQLGELLTGTKTQVQFYCYWRDSVQGYRHLHWVINRSPQQQFYAVAMVLEAYKPNTNFFYALLQHNPDLMVVKDAQQRYVFCNDAFCQFVGQSPANLLGKSAQDVFNIAEFEHVTAQDEIVLKTGKTHIGEICLHDKTRQPHYFISKKVLYQPEYSPPFIIAHYNEFTSHKLLEQALRAHEERFELAIQGSQHGLWDWDLRSNEIYLSPRWKGLLGYEDAEIPNHLDALCQYVHPDDFMHMWGDIEAYLDKRVARYESIYRMRHKNGDDCWVLARAAALWDKDEHPYRMVGTYVDITERKNIERALFESQALLAAIFDVTPIGLCVADMQGRFVRVNQAFCELYGYSADELLQENFLKILPPAQHENVLKLHQDFLNNRLSDIPNEWIVQTKSGENLTVQITLGRLQLPNGSFLRVTTTTDITQRKRNEEERNRLFNLSVDMQSIIDFTGQFIDLNPAWESILGWSKVAFLEKSALEFVHPADMKSTLNMLDRLQQGEIILNFENRYRCKNGGYRWLSWNSYPLIDQAHIYSITRDVSGSKHAEEKIAHQQHFIRLVVDSIPSLIFIKDRLGNFIFANQAVAELLGTNLESLLNHEKIEFTHPLENLEYCLITTPNFPDSNQMVASESVCTTAKGEERCFHLVKKPFLYEEGEILVLTVGTDISERYNLERKFKDTIAELETILNSSVIGIAYVKNTHFVRVNHKLCDLLGYSSDKLLNLSLVDLFAEVEDYQRLLARAQNLLQAGKEYDAGHWLRREDQSLFYSRIVGKAVDASDLEKGSIWMFEDTTLQRQSERNLNLMRTVFESTADGILITDLNCVIEKVNPAMSQITGYNNEELYGKKTSFLAAGRHSKEYYQQMWESINKTGHWQGEIWNRRKQGEPYVAWLSISAIMDEEQHPVQYMAVLSDISRLQEDIEQARYLANYDYLTKLPNRALFHSQLGRAQAWAKRHHRLFAIFFIDLDGFKAVNDQYGHAIGDLLLQDVAERLKNCVRETDMIARFGGDEFTLLLTEVSHHNSIEMVAHKILEQLRLEFKLEVNVAHVSASIGIAIYPDDESDLNKLMNYADRAMFYAKEQGKNQIFFHDEVPTSWKMKE
jgi:diguanylate cyclase (GGDEF)-like protein/PAS domain S-box-containing protein